MAEDLIEYRLNKMEKSFSEFIKSMESVPATLEAIQKDLSENQQLKKDVAQLKAWRTGILMVITVGAFVFGYFIQLLSVNLELIMKDTAMTVV